MTDRFGVYIEHGSPFYTHLSFQVANYRGKLGSLMSALDARVTMMSSHVEDFFNDEYDFIVCMPHGGEVETDRLIREAAINPTKLALRARATDTPFVYVSTAWVFGGSDPEHRIFEQPRPLSDLGVAHWWGERSVRAVNPDAVIVRSGLIHGVRTRFTHPGGLPLPWEFVRTKARLPALIDLPMSITLDWDFIDRMMSICYAIKRADAAGGTYHIGPNHPMTMFDFMVAGEFAPRTQSLGIWARLGNVQVPSSLFLSPTHPAQGPEFQWDYLKNAYDLMQG